MDQSEYPSLPRLNHLHARLAAQSRRVAHIANRHLDKQLEGGAGSELGERLFRAAAANDRAATADAVDALAKLPREPDNGPLITAAEAVAGAIANKEPAEAQHRLAALFNECRERAKSRRPTQ